MSRGKPGRGPELLGKPCCSSSPDNCSLGRVFSLTRDNRRAGGKVRFSTVYKMHLSRWCWTALRAWEVGAWGSRTCGETCQVMAERETQAGPWYNNPQGTWTVSVLTWYYNLWRSPKSHYEILRLPRLRLPHLGLFPREARGRSCRRPRACC